MIIADTVNIGFHICDATQAVSLWHDGPPDERNPQVISCQAFSPQWPMNTRNPRVSVHGRTIFLMHINERSDVICSITMPVNLLSSLIMIVFFFNMR